MKKILLVDDEEKLRNLMARIIGLEGFEVLQAGNGKEAWSQLERHEVDLVLCDVKLPDSNGVEMVEKIKSRFPQTEIILLTAYGTIPDGVKAIRNGAFDYLTKGDDNNKIIPLIYKALEKAASNKRPSDPIKPKGSTSSFGQIIGKSKPIAEAIELAKKVALTQTTVLLTGETGTGKEVFAQAIHRESPRSKQNFVAINCAAFGRDLLESEMFGHKAGAFTGAGKDQKGLFEEADSGTIFLDEIGEMAIDLQAKLLRVLETGTFFRIGENKPTKVDVRIIAATNRDLQEEITRGRFREDLFYRISVFQIHLPPLRERVNDIEPLAMAFLETFSDKSQKKIHRISGEYLDALKQHEWNGNIRELKNCIERSVILSDGEELTIESLPVGMQPFSKMPSGTSSKREPLSAFELANAEKIHIQKVLNYTNGNKTKTAELLHIALTTLYRKLNEYGLE